MKRIALACMLLSFSLAYAAEVLENAYLKLVVEERGGKIMSLVDKSTGKEYIQGKNVHTGSGKLADFLYQPVEILFLNRRESVLALAAQGKNTAEEPRQTAGTTTFERVLPGPQPFYRLGMKDNLRGSDSQHLVKKPGMVIVRVRKKNILDLFGRHAALLQTFAKNTVGLRIARIHKHITAIHADQIAVNHPIPKIVNSHQSLPCSASSMIAILPESGTVS